jgi:hypothetical protein
MSDMNGENQDNSDYRPINIGSIISISHFQDNDAFICSDGHVKNDV